MDYGPIVLGIMVMVGLVVLAKINKKPSGRGNRRARHQPAHSMSLGKHDFSQQWQRIEQVMAQPGLESTRSALFEADKLLDAALRQSGFQGETMGERLKNARGHFGSNPVYQGLWEAHKMRNAMAHELGFDLPKSVAQEQLQKFRAGLLYLKVL